MDSIFTDHYRVPSYEVGQDRMLKISSILKLMQETAGRHLDQDGHTYENMRKGGIVFLLTNIALEITRLPNYNEEIEISTWFLKAKGAQFIRNMRFSDSQGKTLIEAQTLWVIVNPNTHKILRPSKLPFRMPEEGAETVGITAGRIVPATEVRECGKRVIRFSDIDCNRHMNNAVYADIVFDFFPVEIAEKDVNEFRLSFLGEALLNEEILISCGEDSGGGFYFQGDAKTHKCFEASVKMYKKTIAFIGKKDYTRIS